MLNNRNLNILELNMLGTSDPAWHFFQGQVFGPSDPVRQVECSSMFFTAQPVVPRIQGEGHPGGPSGRVAQWPK